MRHSVARFGLWSIKMSATPARQPKPEIRSTTGVHTNTQPNSDVIGDTNPGFEAPPLYECNTHQTPLCRASADVCHQLESGQLYLVHTQ